MALHSLSHGQVFDDLPVITHAIIKYMFICNHEQIFLVYVSDLTMVLTKSSNDNSNNFLHEIVFHCSSS